MSMAGRIVVILALASPALAGDRVTDMHMKQLDLVEQDLVRLAEAMPPAAYGFKPSAGAFDGVRTFGQQVKHTATMIFMTAAIVLQEKSPYGPGTNDNGPDDIEGKEPIVDYLKRSIAYARKAMASLNETNHLELTCQGRTLMARINGVQVALVEDDTYRSGRLGVGAGGSAAITDARFDNRVAYRW